MKTIAALQKLGGDAAEKSLRNRDEGCISVVVGMATCGIAAGHALSCRLSRGRQGNLKNVVVTQTGCIAYAGLEPIFEVYQPGKEKVTMLDDGGKGPECCQRANPVNGKVVDDTQSAPRNKGGDYKNEIS
jgi:NADP-reducing hydrogenase subunit HndB